MTVSIIPQSTPQYEFVDPAATVSAVAVIGGTNYAVKSCSVQLNAHGASDTADIVLPLHLSPDFTTMFKNLAWVAVQLYVGVFQAQAPSPPSAQLATTGKRLLYSGSIDLNSMVFQEDTITLKCRSLASLLIDNRITGIPRNMTTLQFIEATSKQYGLTAMTKLLPKQPAITIAALYAHDFAVGIQNDRIWDVYMKAAEFDGADIWVTGSTLYYYAPSLITRTILNVKYGKDVETLTADHSTAAKSIRVEVRIYNQRTRVSSTQRIDLSSGLDTSVTSSGRVVTSSPEFGTKNSSTTSYSPDGTVSFSQSTQTGGPQQTAAARGPDNPSGPLIYKFYRPNWSLEDANTFAQSTLRKLQMAAYTIQLRIPLTVTKFSELSQTSLIRLSGVPMQQVNADYWPRRITFEIDPDNPGIDIEAVSVALPEGQV